MHRDTFTRQAFFHILKGFGTLSLNDFPTDHNVSIQVQATTSEVFKLIFPVSLC